MFDLNTIIICFVVFIVEIILCVFFVYSSVKFFTILDIVPNKIL